MILLDYPNLLSCVNDIITNIQTFRPTYYNEFRLQYDTGCRIKEAVDKSFWSYSFPNWILEPQKNNNLRTFSPAELSQNSLEYLFSPWQLIPDKFYNKYDYVFQNSTEGRVFTVGQKHCTTHIFRHLYAKRLKNEGLLDFEIQIKLGEKTIDSARNYIYSDVYVNFL